MSLDIKQFRETVLHPVLDQSGLWSQAAENLVMGTIAQESRFTYLKQIKGPALGLIQMEPATHADIWTNYLAYHPDTVRTIKSVCGLSESFTASPDTLIYNLRYAVMMCRVHYLRRPEPLPDADDIEGLAHYWKQWYNTALGAGTTDEFIRNYAQVG